MTAKTYSVEFRRQGIVGDQELIVTVYDASTGDTISFGADLNRVDAAVMRRSNALPSVVSVLVSGTGFVSRTVCLPAAASLAGDNIRLWVLGPANASVA